MAFSLDFLRTLLGVGQPAGQAVDPSMAPANADADPGAIGVAQLPPAAPLPQMDLSGGREPDPINADPQPVRAAAQDQGLSAPVSSGMAPRLPQAQPQGLPQGQSQDTSAPVQTLPQVAGNVPVAPPTKAVHGWLINALDRGLLNGGVTAHDNQVFAAQQAAYQLAQMRQFAGTLPTDQLRAQFYADPQGFMTEYEKNLGPTKLAQFESVTQPGGGLITAPGFDEKSGSAIQIGPNATMTASPSVGGDYSAKDGVIVGGRTGQVVGRYALPQVRAPGASIGSVIPGVTGGPEQQAPGAPSAYQGAPANPTSGVPPLSAVPTLLPGAKVTSGLRTPLRNAQVGGVPNSYHLQGTADAPGAIDLQPAPGQTMADLASAAQAAAAGTKVLNEGNHVHIQPAARSTAVPVTLPQAGPQADATGTIIDQGATAAPIWAPPAWNPQTGKFEQRNTATGEVRDAGAGTFDPQKLRQDVLGHEDYKQATASMAAYKAMIGNADKMTGPSAYAMLDTFARAINPGAVARPQVIKTIEENLGLPAQFVGSLESKVGQGNLPAESRQQILDAVVKFAQAHWDAANRLNQGNVGVATRTGLDPRNVTAPLDDRPTGAHLTLPPKDHLMNGDVYMTSRGMAKWNGQGFVPYGR